MSVIDSIGKGIFRLGYEISPIILNNGVASEVTGGLLPIVAITEAANFANSLLQGTFETNLDDFFAHFQILPGGTLLDFQIGQYPFANQQVAANAIIEMPLALSLLMIAPAKSSGAYVTKLITMTALKFTLEQHILLGGSFTIATPAQLIPNMLLLKLHDVTPQGDKQVQSMWQFDFWKPLITEQDAQAAQSSLMSNITNQTPISGQPATSGVAGAVGSPVAAPGSGPGAANLTGASVGGYTPGVGGGAAP